jgi:hypothetical protein
LSRRWQEPAPRQDRPQLNADVRTRGPMSRKGLIRMRILFYWVLTAMLFLAVSGCTPSVRVSSRVKVKLPPLDSEREDVVIVEPEDGGSWYRWIGCDIRPVAELEIELDGARWDRSMPLPQECIRGFKRKARQLGCDAVVMRQITGPWDSKAHRVESWRFVANAVRNFESGCLPVVAFYGTERPGCPYDTLGSVGEVPLAYDVYDVWAGDDIDALADSARSIGGNAILIEFSEKAVSGVAIRFTDEQCHR